MHVMNHKLRPLTFPHCPRSPSLFSSSPLSSSPFSPLYPYLFFVSMALTVFLQQARRGGKVKNKRQSDPVIIEPTQGPGTTDPTMYLFTSGARAYCLSTLPGMSQPSPHSFTNSFHHPRQECALQVVLTPVSFLVHSSLF